MKIETIKEKIKISSWLVFLGVYLFAGGVTFGAFSLWGKEGEIVSPEVQKEMVETHQSPQMAFSGPRTEECPINGEFFTKEQREIWEKRRPLLVMIENHQESRPQSGLTRADVVYEAVAEGGITRFMGVYYCRATEPSPRKYDLGPVRSARIYFLSWAQEYGEYPLYLHVGGAGECADPTVDPRAKALCKIQRLGWLDKDHWNDLNQFALSYKVCRREPGRTGETKATEHTMYCDSQAAWQEAERRKLEGWSGEFRPWHFKDDNPQKTPTAKEVSFPFWRGYKGYEVTWQYDSQNNIYTRFNGGQPHIDFLTKKPLQAKVVIVQFTQEIGPVDEHKHLLYKTVGRGKALVFQDGGVTQAIWKKKTEESRTLFFDLKGKEIKLNRGQIWIEIVPLGNKVEY